MTPQLRALAGRHARYFDNTLVVHGGPSDPLRDASFNARETPRCGARSLPGEDATLRRALLQQPPFPGANQGGAPRAPVAAPMGPSFFYSIREEKKWVRSVCRKAGTHHQP